MLLTCFRGMNPLFVLLCCSRILLLQAYVINRLRQEVRARAALSPGRGFDPRSHHYNVAYVTIRQGKVNVEVKSKREFCSNKRPIQLFFLNVSSIVVFVENVKVKAFYRVPPCFEQGLQFPGKYNRLKTVKSVVIIFTPIQYIYLITNSLSYIALLYLKLYSI